MYKLTEIRHFKVTFALSSFKRFLKRKSSDDVSKIVLRVSTINLKKYVFLDIKFLHYSNIKCIRKNDDDRLITNERPMNISPTLNVATSGVTSPASVLLNATNNNVTALKTTACTINKTESDSDTLIESNEDALAGVETDEASANSPLGPANKRQRLVE